MGHYSYFRKIERLAITQMMCLTAILFSGCNQSSTMSSPTFSSPSVAHIAGNNVMSITVGCGYVNQPCVSVTICEPNNANNCQTIPNLLLDTGSVGLRIFSSVVNSSVSSVLPAITSSVNGRPYGACAVFGDGSYQWGPVKSADVTIGSMTKVNIPIQLIDFTFGDTGTACKNSNGNAISQDAAASGYNGIMGIEFFLEDCGASCATSALPYYFTCTSGGTVTCTSATIPRSKQLKNPVGALSSDNNGYYIQLPSVTSAGATNPTGYLVFGINTQSNNSSGTLAVLAADPANGHVQTVYNGTTYTSSIIDTGSNANYFSSTLSVCGASLSSFYCPASPSVISAVHKDYTGSTSSAVSFTVARADQMYSPGNAFSTLAGPLPSGLSGYFDWGLPFFFGRTVWGGIEGRTATGIGTGPYWAY